MSVSKTLTQSQALEKVQEFCSQNAHGVVEILGPTGSGKTGFSLRVAKYLNKNFTQNSEIISVDSRQIYRYLDISSAKIRPDEMGEISHHGLDLLDPDEGWNAYQFQQYAYRTIEEIQARNGRVILCGGTMLWLDAVSENYSFPHEKNPTPSFLHAQEKHTPSCHPKTPSCHSKTPSCHPKTPSCHPGLNPGSSPAQRDISFTSEASSIEESTAFQKAQSKFPTLKLSLHLDRTTLYARLDERAQDMFANGLIEEVRDVLKKFPHPHHNVATSIGIPEVQQYLDGEIGYERAVELNQQRNRNYAKRQLTWWRNREDIIWVDAESI